MSVVINTGFYTGPLNSEAHTHSCCEIFYLKKGHICLNIDGKEYMPKENSVHIISPMEKHAVTCLSDVYERYIIFLDLENFELHFTNQPLSRILKNRPAEFQHVFHSTGQDFQSVFRNCIEEFEQHSDCTFTNLRMVSIITELLILLYRCHPERFDFGHENIRLSEIQKYIEDNYDKHIRIADISNKFFINQYYLSHTFKEFTGYSPKQYLSKTRLIHVRQLLAATDLKVAEIAERTGFETINDLSRQFKSEFHISPTEFRKGNFTITYH